MVVPDVIGQEAFLLEVGHRVRHEVVEAVITSLQRLLVSQTRLLQQVHNHVSTFYNGGEILNLRLET